MEKIHETCCANHPLAGVLQLMIASREADEEKDMTFSWKRFKTPATMGTTHYGSELMNFKGKQMKNKAAAWRSFHCK